MTDFYWQFVHINPFPLFTLSFIFVPRFWKSFFKTQRTKEPTIKLEYLTELWTIGCKCTCQGKLPEHS